ncbi:PepSY domain-containing protein [Luteibacter aegosomatis]|uniref:PepSY-associated TM helix domain-containing protein n=1 Tax=Luteibacter aegosomatis TaxID=2911537 RepID=UPI001FF7AE47|nr:PepSY-associated TM helix domain-containing protein [Luteibacter aegosomatis]UPG83964.1 PepSY domain-containing protein [Luteibacter aegosomatis]
MKGGLRQSMAFLHTWAGLLFGWLLLAVFVTGTTAYFQDEITRWMQPEIKGERHLVASAEGAVDYMRRHAQGAETWSIQLPGKRSVAAMGYWKEKGETYLQWRDHAFMVDGRGVRVDARDTTGGWLLYRMHFDLHYVPVLWGRWTVGLAAMFMLVAIVSGVITHRRIFADFFTLRPGKGQRSWLDAHNLGAVLALPFHVMITYTGLVTLQAAYMPWGIAAAYERPADYHRELTGIDAAPTRSGTFADPAPIAGMIAQARARWNGGDPGFIAILIPGDANSVVKITQDTGTSMATRGETLTFDAATGHMRTPPASRGGAAMTESVMVGLHAGRFAPPALRWLYFLSGLMGSAMVATGLVLWTAKRRPRLPDPTRPHVGFRLVERLNVATIAGLPFGIAVYFIANRLLPSAMAHRAAWEANWLFIGWGALLLYVFLRPPRRAWIESLSMVAAAYAAVPAVNALTTDRGLLRSLAAGDLVFAGFDLSMLVTAMGFAFAAWKLHRRPLAPVREARPPRGDIA